MDSTRTQLYQQAADYLSAHDTRLAPVIARVGLCTITPHRNYYQDIAESIIGQQLSVKAAATISQRFKALFGGVLPTPEQIVATDPQQLRAAGLSGRKAAYIHDLARHVIDGRLILDQLDDLSNDEIITRLTDVKGVGEWTAHMFLMFCMGRTNIIAHGDLGVRSGIRTLYGLAELPSPAQVQDIARHYQWQPYASIACWYIWQFLDNKPVVTS